MQGNLQYLEKKEAGKLNILALISKMEEQRHSNIMAEIAAMKAARITAFVRDGNAKRPKVDEN